jgi:uncharacterized protein YjbJ (UPF0337 family)
MVSREVTREGGAMNKDEIKGKIEEIKGELKERLGGAMKDRKTQAEGFVEEQKGKVQEKIGELKEGAERKEPEEEQP